MCLFFSCLYLCLLFAHSNPELETIETVEWHLSISEDDKSWINISKSCLLLALYCIQQNGAVAGDGCELHRNSFCDFELCIYRIYCIVSLVYIFPCTCLLVYVHHISLLVYVTYKFNFIGECW